MKASSRKPLCEEQNDKTVDSFGRHESDGDLPVQTVTLKTFHPYFSVTLDHGERVPMFFPLFSFFNFVM